MTMTATTTTTDNMRVASWNVNGIRARWPRLTELLTCERPDVVCLQETRCSEWHFPSERLREMGYQSRHSPGSQQGGGVAILVREDHRITERSGELDHQRDIAEGHWIEVTTEGITIVSVYVPAGASAGEQSDVGKLAFLEAVARHACDEHSRPLLIAGDFNVAPTDEDVYEPAWFADSYQTGEAERADLRAILDEGNSWTSTARCIRMNTATPAGSSARATTGVTTACASTSCSPARASPHTSATARSTTPTAGAFAPPTTHRWTSNYRTYVPAPAASGDRNSSSGSRSSSQRGCRES